MIALDLNFLIRYYQAMSQRLQALNKQISSDPFAYFGLNSLFSPQHNALLAKVEEFGKKHLTTQEFYTHHEEARFPDYLIPHLQALEIGKYFVPKPYGEELPLIVQGAIIATLAQFDLGFSTFIFLQLPLTGRTLYKLGSEEQKEKYLRDLIGFKTVWGWALTEREVGSNSTRIGTIFYQNTEGLIYLNGNKRWIGNGNRDYIVVYGKNGTTDKNSQVIAAIVDVKSQNLTSVAIQNKTPFRIVQNCQIDFKNVRIPNANFLPYATNYKVGVEDTLKHSRIIVIWNTIGGCIGVYKNALRYALERKQFGRPIAGFQLIQEKLVRIMANVQAVLLAGWRVTELYQQDSSLSTGKIGMFKAWVTERGRLICSLGRELMGGNGLLQQNYAIKAMIDMQALYTYEGSYEMNTLITGFELTGVKAFV